MGLFTRKDSASDSSPSRPRPSVTSEAQAAELRGKARRRLAGAIALVLAAVIILPMMLDSEPVPVSEDIPVRIPDRGTPYQPNVSEPGQTPSAQNGTAPESGQPATPPDLIAGNTQSPAAQPPAQQAPANPPPPQQVPATPPPVQQPVQPPHTQTPPPKPPETKPVEKPPAKPPAKPETSQRSDDGARALALLEGRSPAAQAPAAKPKPAANGNFVLQVASYTTQSDAQERRGKLHQAGVTNAFVEQASINGKQQYRLRVGPFPSREAAQAAQARLRTLGYDNGFIAAQ